MTGRIHTVAVLKATTLLIAVATMFAAAPAAFAVNAFTVNISEKEQKLEHPVDMMWDKWLMWDIGYQRMVCRNAPYIELLNDAASTEPITQFHLTIGDTRFNFGPVENSDLVKLGSTTPGFSISGSTVGSLGDELVVTIGNGGLLPGQDLKFQIKLDVDPSYAATYAASFGNSLPDFRTVLFDMNGVNVYDGITHTSSADNAQAFVLFDPSGHSEKVAFADETVDAGQYFNNNLRAYKAMDPVLIFQIEGSQAVPEPSTFGLAVLGIVGLMGTRRGVRR